MNYKLFIPCAGTGSRLKDLTKNKNKALIKVAGKEVIKYILDKFDEDIPVVIATGYQGDAVEAFLKKEYPKRDIIFVRIDKFEGPGSGLGYSMSKCKEYLQCPFIFNSNDTIVLENIPAPNENYIAYAKEQDVTQFRSVEINGDNISGLCEKKDNYISFPYIGLSGIKDYKQFWESLSERSSDFFQIGESAGLKYLLEKNIPIKGILFTWMDTGNPESLKKTKNNLE